MNKERKDSVFRRVEELEKYFLSNKAKNEKVSRALANFKAKLHLFLGRKFT